MKAPTRLAALLVSVGLAACTTMPPMEQTVSLAELEAGTISRTELIARLGPPHQTFEGGRLIAYSVRTRGGRIWSTEHRERKQTVSEGWSFVPAILPWLLLGTAAQLVLVVDEDDKIVRTDVIKNKRD